MVTTVLSQPILAIAAELPSGGNIVAGQATIGAAGNGLLIEQGSQNAIIEWSGFSVGSNRTVNFQNGAGATLNRVTGADISRIDGNLSATGSLFLINQNGVVVGKDGVIETGGSFVGSTLDVSNADFLNGGDMTFSGNSGTSVINLGKVSSLGGDVALIARHVTNEGTILAPNGTAALVAGREVLMRDAALNDGKFSVRLGDANSSVTEAGMIAAAAVELRANGGNVYALAGNKGGSINATGVSSSGGRVFLTASGGKVRIAKKVRATRNTGAGGDVFVNADIVSVANLLDVSSTTGQGGNIDIGARDTIALEGATLDASGNTGGGRIRVGGEFQGGKGLAEDEVQNVQTLLIDQASTLIADGTGDNANGGTIINWADDATRFAGNISATGTLKGGFAEVSGKVALDYAGLADLRGGDGTAGTLLLDPTDFTIDLAAANTIIGNLAGANVVIATDSAGGGNGDIFVDSAIIYSSAYDLTMLAHRNIEANASIQNEGGGDLNLIAGWDGTTEDPGSAGINPGAVFNIANFAANSYGNGGDVIIGDGTQTSGIAVGSRFGTTTVLAEDLTLTGGSTSGAYAQLGFQATDEGAAYNITGDIDVHTTGNVTAQGGSSSYAYAQIGHVGADVSYDNVVDATVTSAAISIDAGGNLSFAGGDGNYTYAQLGHGGRNANGDHSGDISITASGDLDFSGGSEFHAYAQLGHGGYVAVGDHSGAISIDAGGNLSFAGGDGSYTYTQLGHGGESAYGNLSGEINIAASGNLSFAGGSELHAYAQLGHGGRGAGRNHSGAISITADELSFAGGSGDYTYAQLGHGDASGYSSGTRQGNISVIADGETSIADGMGDDAFGWIGHFSDGGAISNADVAIVTNGLTVSVVDFAGMLANDLEGGNVLIANTLAADENASNDDITIDGTGLASFTSANTLSLVAGGEIYINGSIQNAGTGDIELVGGWDGTTGLDLSSFPVFDVDVVDAADAFGVSDGDVEIGDATQTTGIAVGSAYGRTVALGHDVEITASDGTDNAYAQLGFVTNSQNADGDIYVKALDDVFVFAGRGDGAYAQIGHGEAGTAGFNASGDIDISAVEELVVEAWRGDGAFAQVGHGGGAFAGDATGNISIEVGSVEVAGNRGYIAYAQIGHGGYASSGDMDGEITVLSSDSIEVLGGYGQLGYAQIGHGGLDSDGTKDGKITVDAEFFVGLGLGEGTGAYAQIGHGGTFSEDTNTGDIFVEAEGIIMQGGYNLGTYAQIGHGGDYSVSNATGNIDINADYVGLGNGDADEAYGQIGHGGSYSSGALEGDIDINADEIEMIGGTQSTAYAQIGHGDAADTSTGTRKGNITIVASGEISVEDGVGAGWISHRTNTTSGISDAEVYLKAASFDGSLTTQVASGGMSFLPAAMIENAIEGGDVTIIATDSGLSPDRAMSFVSDHQLIIQAENNIVLDSGETIDNGGFGNIILAAGEDFHNDTGSTMPISTSGRWLVYSYDPDNNRDLIANPDFDRYSTIYDPSDPTPAGFASGNGLIYEVDDGSTGTPTTPTTPTDTDDPTDTDEPTDTDDPTDSDDPTDPGDTPETSETPTDLNPFGPSIPRVLKFSSLPCETSGSPEPETTTTGLCRTVLN